MHLLPTALPEMSGIGLPETGNKLNVTIGAPRCAFDKVPCEMKSNDPKIVADYVRKNFKAFELVDYEDFAQQWVNQGWNRTGQVHCNFYHSTDINVVLMGDACHATSPSIGMGMNTALRDAQVFYQLLQEHEDNFDLVLPNYSRLRVKEGNALTDLAYYLYCFDTTQQVIETIHMVVRGIFHRMLPSLVYDHPQNMIGLIQYNLSDVYNRAVQLGIIGKHRRINDEMRQAYFEQTTGMVDIDAIKRTKRLLSKTILCALVSAILAYGYLRTTTTTATA
jgi:FAD binding domain